MTDHSTERGLSRGTNAKAAGRLQDQPARAHKAGPICVIDDDLSVRQSLSILLEAFGIRVNVYAAGAEFLADEERYKAGCVIIDQHMPGTPGMETLAVLRREAPDMPVILVTGRLDSAIAARASELGVSGILEKPFSAPRLLDLVRTSLRPSHDRRAI